MPASVYFSDFAMMVGSLFCLCVLGAAASSGDIRAAANRLEAAGPVSRAALRDAELDILIQSGEKSAAEFAPKDGCVKVRGGGMGGVIFVSVANGDAGSRAPTFFSRRGAAYKGTEEAMASPRDRHTRRPARTRGRQPVISARRLAAPPAFATSRSPSRSQTL